MKKAVVWFLYCANAEHIFHDAYAGEGRNYAYLVPESL